MSPSPAEGRTGSEGRVTGHVAPGASDGNGDDLTKLAGGVSEPLAHPAAYVVTMTISAAHHCIRLVDISLISTTRECVLRDRYTAVPASVPRRGGCTLFDGQFAHA